MQQLAPTFVSRPCPACGGTRTKQVSDAVVAGRVRCFCLLCGHYFAAAPLRR